MSTDYSVFSKVLSKPALFSMVTGLANYMLLIEKALNFI